MSTKKLTLQTEKFQRASNEIMVLSSNPINGKIYPSFVLPTESIYLKNTKYLVLKSAADTADAYITRDASDNLLIANLKISGELQLTHTMASGNQRYLLLKEYGATDTQAIQAPYTLTIVTENDDIQLLPAGDIIVKTYERHVQIAASLTGLPANQPAEVDFFTVSGLQFATTGTKYVFCQWEVPDDWDGTDIHIEVDWFPDSGAMTAPAAVKWDVEYAAVAEGEAHGATSKTLSVTYATTTAQYLSIHSRVTMAYNDATQPLTKQDHIYFKISRDTAVANDFTGTVTVSAFEIMYNSNMLSRGN